MRRLFIAYIVILFLVLAEQNILQHITIFGKKAELLILCLAYFSLFYKQKEVLLLSALAGLIRDVNSSTPFGIHILVFAASSILISSASKRIAKENFFTDIFYGFIAIFFILTCLAMLQIALTNDTINFSVHLKESVLPKSIIGCLLAPFLFKLLSRIIK